MTPEQIADFETRYLDKFKDVVSLKHKGFKKGNCVVLGNEQTKSKSIPGYDIFEITKADGTIQDIRVC